MQPQPKQQQAGSRWPAFASLSANSRTQPWKQDASPTDSSTQQQQQQQQQQGVTQEQLERDVQQLAGDVFHKGQELAGGRYKLVDKIPIRLGLADGRFTTTWHGKDLTNNRDVILKCLEAGDTNSYNAGMREAALHAASGRCSNIVPLLDAFEHRSSSGRHPVMVLAPCGTNLLNVAALYTSPQAMEANAREGAAIGGICDNPAALKRLAKDSLTALNHLHKHGLVHMDLGPDNVLLDKEFVSQQELHAQALMPQGNWLKGLQTKWRLFQAVLRAGSQPDKAAQTEQSLMDEMQAVVAKETRYHEGTLHTATFLLTDFGRAVPYRDVLPGLSAAGAEGVQDAGQDGPQQMLQRHNKDGLVVFSDPTYQPPEEILGLSYIAPSYDMWKLGCLLFEAATDTKLFDARLRGPLEACYGEAGFSDQHYLLDAMTTTLGHIPQEFGRSSPLYADFFCGQAQRQDADGKQRGSSRHKAPDSSKKKRKGSKGAEASEAGDMLLINAGPVKATPRAKPLQVLLLERTVLNDQEAQQLAGFLSEVLKWEPSSRATAEQMLQHEWLASVEPLQ